jgi:hypothetical protein
MNNLSKYHILTRYDPIKQSRFETASPFHDGIQMVKKIKRMTKQTHFEANF